MRKRFCLVSVFIFYFFSPLVKSTELNYVGLGVERDDYHTQLLEEIVAHIPNKNYNIKRFSAEIPHPRAFGLLAKNSEVDIVIAYATEMRETDFSSIKLPIMKGLNGWRLSSVHQQNIDLFSNVYTLKQLRAFTPGQMIYWTDKTILEENEIEVSTGSNFVGLYGMLNLKRFDYFPRSILEIDQEVNTFTMEYKLNIAIEPHILIYYPTAFYFYVNKNNTELSNDLNLGFEEIIKNGRFEQVFKFHFGAIIEQAKQHNRRVIHLNNPLLPKSVPLHRKELWETY